VSIYECKSWTSTPAAKQPKNSSIFCRVFLEEFMEMFLLWFDVVKCDVSFQNDIVTQEDHICLN
jgi:hypothetical protein